MLNRTAPLPNAALPHALSGSVIDEQNFIGTELAKPEADWYTESEIRNSFCE
jgi:hypothetical protein